MGEGGLGVAPGTRVLCVSNHSSGRRAAVVPHYLRKAGYVPLTCELPDASPTAPNVTAVVEMAKRTGSGAVAAYGSASVMHVGRAAAAIVTNGGKVKDYAASLGGEAIPRVPSLPFLAVPSCPGGAELLREPLVLWDGVALGSLKPERSSLQAAVLDPCLSTSLDPEDALRTGYATLVHAIEAYVRTDSDAATRERAWLAVQLAAHSLRPSLATPRILAARMGLAVASALVSSAMATGPLGPSRGIALTVASRYRIPYSTALTAVAPEIVSATAEFLEDRLEEEEEEEGEEGEDSDGKDSAVSSRDNLEEDDAAALRRRKVWASRRRDGMWGTGTGAGAGGKGERARAGGAAHASSAARDEKMEKEDKLADEALERRLTEYAKEASEAAGESLGGYGGGEEREDSDLVRTVRRFRHVVSALKMAAAADGSKLDVAGLPLGEVPPARVADGIQLNELGGLLLSLRKAAEGAGAAPAQALRDYALPEADLRVVADAAEVEDNTLACLVQLKSKDILDMLKRS
jgi:alcohol dehydrogenase class IV